MTLAEGLSFLFRELTAFIRKVWWVVLVLGFAQSAGIALDFVSYARGWTNERYEIGIYLWTAFALLVQLLVLYILTRFLALRRDVRAACSFNKDSMRSFAPLGIAYVVWQFATSFASIETQEAFGVGWGALWLLADFVVGPLFALWVVSAAGGKNVVSPFSSARIMAPHLVWAFAFLLVAMLPLFFLAWLTPVAFAFGWADADWAGLFFGGKAVIHNVASNLIFFAAIYVIAQRGGLKVIAKPLMGRPTPGR